VFEEVFRHENPYVPTAYDGGSGIAGVIDGHCVGFVLDWAAKTLAGKRDLPDKGRARLWSVSARAHLSRIEAAIGTAASTDFNMIEGGAYHAKLTVKKMIEGPAISCDELLQYLAHSAPPGVYQCIGVVGSRGHSVGVAKFVDHQGHASFLYFDPDHGLYRCHSSAELRSCVQGVGQFSRCTESALVGLEKGRKRTDPVLYEYGNMHGAGTLHDFRDLPVHSVTPNPDTSNSPTSPQPQLPSRHPLPALSYGPRYPALDQPQYQPQGYSSLPVPLGGGSHYFPQFDNQFAPAVPSVAPQFRQMRQESWGASPSASRPPEGPQRHWGNPGVRNLDERSTVPQHPDAGRTLRPPR